MLSGLIGLLIDLSEIKISLMLSELLIEMLIILSELKMLAMLSSLKMLSILLFESNDSSAGFVNAVLSSTKECLAPKMSGMENLSLVEELSK